MKAEQKQRRDHKQKAVQEHPSGREDDRIAELADLPRQNRVKRPDQRRQNRQQVPGGIDFEHEAPVKADQDNPRHRDQKAQEEPLAGPLPLEEEIGREGGEERRSRQNHPDIRREREGQRDIFKQKIQRHAAQARREKEPLLFKALGLQKHRPRESQREEPQQKAQEQNLHRLKALEQDFGRNKGGPPDENGEHRRQVPRKRPFFVHSCPLPFLAARGG